MIKKLGIIGGGKIGEALAAGLVSKAFIAASDILIAEHLDSRRTELKAKSLQVTADNREAVRASNAVILAVKPKDISAVLDEIGSEFGPTKLLISVAAGIGIHQLESALPPHTPVIRVMPNMAISIGEGMSVLSPGSSVARDDIDWAAQLFRSVGRALVLEERHMDAVTGLSGSGPAYVYVVIESLADAALKLGLPREAAFELAAQTLLGAARNVLITGEHPAKLKDMVTTPAGTTVEGLYELEKGGVRTALMNAVIKAAERSKELSKKQ